MARHLPQDVAWTETVLEVENRWCGKCGRRLFVCAHRRRRLLTLNGPRILICKFRPPDLWENGLYHFQSGMPPASVYWSRRVVPG